MKERERERERERRERKSSMEHVVIAPGFVNHEMAMWRRVQIWEDQDMNEEV